MAAPVAVGDRCAVAGRPILSGGAPWRRFSLAIGIRDNGRQSVDDQQVLREIAPPDTNLAYAAMRELRTSLSSSEEFVDQVDLIQRPQGYRLVGVFHGEDVDAVSVAGFRQSTSLSWGRHIYVDDLSTIKSNRGQGFAGQLLAWIHNEAVRLGCGQIHLDSGVGPDRRSAHRLYLNQGYEISAHHFVRLV